MGKKEKTPSNLDELLSQFKKQLSGGNAFTLEKALTELNTSKTKFKQLLNELELRGTHVRFNSEARVYYVQKTPIRNESVYREEELERTSEGVVKFGLVSDTHLASKHDRLDLLEDFFDLMQKEGVNIVYHSGDCTDGFNVYPGHANEVRVYGVNEQADYFIKNWPQRKGMKTRFINGNHDLKAFLQTGADIGTLIENDDKRKDLTYLGQYCRDVDIGNSATLRLLHPAGAPSYARCFDDKTEILTENGWKFLKDLSKDEKVATLNQKNWAFEWQLPTDIINEEYNGKLIHFKARSFDLLVTPNHRMLVRRYPIRSNRIGKILKYPQKARKQCDYSWGFKEAWELINFTRQSWQMTKVSQKWDGKKIPLVEIPFRSPKKYATHPIKHLGTVKIEDIAELIAWYVTEGHIKKKKGCALSICQSQRVNPENHAQILSLLKRFNFDPKQHGIDNKDICVYSVELCEYLISQCGAGSAHKYLPKWLKEQPEEVLKIIFDTMIKGDGWKNGIGWGYKSISKKLLEDLAEIAIKLGYGVTFSGKDYVTVSKQQTYPTINTKPNMIDYSGRIYCVSVPNQIILVRRNGRTIWSGNSYKAQRYVGNIEGGQKPSILGFGHWHGNGYFLERNVHTLLDGTFQDETDFSLRLGLQNCKGAWIIETKIEKDGSLDWFKPMWKPYY